MTKILKKFDALPKNNKKLVGCLLLLFIAVLIMGIKSTFAYYEDVEDSLPILAAKIGDFDIINGDINIVIYKETGVNSDQYAITYGVPSFGYNFYDTQTKCINPITKKDVTCTKDGSGDCRYSYNSDTREFSLTSNQKVTCKFYFKMTIASDVDVLVFIENSDVADRTYNGKSYQFVNDVPTDGYTYSNHYTCDNNVGTVAYDDASHKLTVTSTNKTRCYAYFDKVS